MPLRLAISMGDYNGIGPEIILKSLSQFTTKKVTPVVIGHKNIFDFYAYRSDSALPKHKSINGPGEIKDGVINFLNLNGQETITPEPGTFSEQAGRFAMKAVEKGIECCMQQQTHALITAPICKEAVNKAGFHIPGHTEFLAEKTETSNYMMILAKDNLRVGLVTIHIPVSKIADQINTDAVLRNIQIMHAALRDDFNIHEPQIAVLGLNPHAGDGGIIGREEIEVITPAIVKAEADKMNVSGPFPADGFFGNQKFKGFDGILAMYHDQGLVPFKTLSFGGGVNITAGLPIVRTSPDHGTAFDIAGKNEANPSSFIEAVKVAIKLSTNRFDK